MPTAQSQYVIFVQPKTLKSENITNLDEEIIKRVVGATIVERSKTGNSVTVGIPAALEQELRKAIPFATIDKEGSLKLLPETNLETETKNSQFVKEAIARLNAFPYPSKEAWDRMVALETTYNRQIVSGDVQGKAHKEEDAEELMQEFPGAALLEDGKTNEQFELLLRKALEEPSVDSQFVKEAMARMNAMPDPFSSEEWDRMVAFESAYKGPIVSGDPKGERDLEGNAEDSP